MVAMLLSCLLGVATAAHGPWTENEPSLLLQRRAGSPRSSPGALSGKVELSFHTGTPRLQLYIGSPPQGPLDTMIDLGSTDSWVFSRNCVYEKLGPACAAGLASKTSCDMKGYDESKSSTYRATCEPGEPGCFVCMTFAAGSTSGHPAQDILHLADGSFPHVLGLMTRSTPSLKTIKSDALVGLGFAGNSRLHHPGIIRNLLVEDGSSYFTLCMPQCGGINPLGSTSCPNSTYPGFICFGCEDHCNDAKTWSPIVPVMDSGSAYRWWLLQLSDVHWRGGDQDKADKANLCASGGERCSGLVLDSGFALSAIPAWLKPLLVTALMEELPGCSPFGSGFHDAVPPGVPSSVQAVPTFGVACPVGHRKVWPKLSLLIGEVRLEVDPIFYIEVRSSNLTVAVFCDLNMADFVILGASMLNAFYMKMHIDPEPGVQFKGASVV